MILTDRPDCGDLILTGRPNCCDLILTGRPDCGDLILTGRPDRGDLITTGRPDCGDLIITGRQYCSDLILTGRPDCFDLILTGRPDCGDLILSTVAKHRCLQTTRLSSTRLKLNYWSQPGSVGSSCIQLIIGDLLVLQSATEHRSMTLCIDLQKVGCLQRAFYRR